MIALQMLSKSEVRMMVKRMWKKNRKRVSAAVITELIKNKITEPKKISGS